MSDGEFGFDQLLASFDGAGPSTPAKPEVGDKPADKPAEAPAPAEAAEDAETPEAPEAAAADEPVPTAEVMRQRYRKLQRQEAKQAKREEEHKRERASFEAENASLKADLKALLEGDFDTQESIIRRRTGTKDAVELFDKLSKKALALNADAPAANAEIKRELAELRQLLERQTEAQQTERRTTTEQRTFLDALHGAAKDSDEFPELAEFAAVHELGSAGVAKEMFEYAQQRIAAEQRPVTARDICNDFAQKLRSPRGRAHVAALVAKKNGNGAPKTPPAPARGKPPGTSVSPSLAAQPATAERRLTPEEQEAFRDRILPDALRELGLLQ